ncbi:MAG: DNA helicase UvrD [Candidatus Omnitrophica bacterium]|nr:DNA helicase UvrD [Candidatus Omnitrophota bacterium]MBI3010289.1 DNA helicase UvrD [Candidatus Omnitrophota bacterium]
MAKFIADFHIHSRYSRATSKDLTIQELAKWSKIKGIGLLGTGDFTHPLWMQELSDHLRESGNGLYEYDGVRFILTAEVNTLFYKAGKAHQIHHILIAPSFFAVERICRELESFGSLSIDGRPTFRMEAWRLAEVVLGIEPRCLIVPAHAWTPWFAIFGSTSGFDTVEECFEHQAKNIFVLETGLSSDPAMNWRLSKLDRYALISNSDSHSARKIGREANVFDCELDYDVIAQVLRQKDPKRFLGTLEFFPEEGKYHYDGHRNCKVRWAPAETKKNQYRCSSCGKRVTVGVMHRVEELADRPEGTVPERSIPFKRIVPLEEIIADALKANVGTQAVEREYQQLIYKCGTEFNVLLEASEAQLRQATSGKIAEGVLRTRLGKVTVEPGFDGEYGKVRIFMDDERIESSSEEQLTLF